MGRLPALHMPHAKTSWCLTKAGTDGQAAQLALRSSMHLLLSEANSRRNLPRKGAEGSSRIVPAPRGQRTERAGKLVVELLGNWHGLWEACLPAKLFTKSSRLARPNPKAPAHPRP